MSHSLAYIELFSDIYGAAGIWGWGWGGTGMGGGDWDGGGGLEHKYIQ